MIFNVWFWGDIINILYILWWGPAFFYFIIIMTLENLRKIITFIEKMESYTHTPIHIIFFSYWNEGFSSLEMRQRRVKGLAYVIKINDWLVENQNLEEIATRWIHLPSIHITPIIAEKEVHVGLET